MFCGDATLQICGDGNSIAKPAIVSRSIDKQSWPWQAQTNILGPTQLDFRQLSLSISMCWDYACMLLRGLQTKQTGSLSIKPLLPLWPPLDPAHDWHWHFVLIVSWRIFGLTSCGILPSLVTRLPVYYSEWIERNYKDLASCPTWLLPSSL